MLFTTARRVDRETQVRDRLAHLMDQARTRQADRADDDLPPDQPWVDESGPAPPVARSDQAGGPWWRRGRAGRLVERWLPGEPTPIPRRRLSVGLIIAVAGGVAVAIGVALSSGGGSEPPPGLPAAQAVVTPSSATPASSSIVISVVGRVVRPGLVTLPEGARVADALHAAGGPVPGVDVGGLNIARRLMDGEQIYVGVPAPPEAQPGAPPGGPEPQKVDLNTASVAQLDTLPGVGAVTAQRIVDWRAQHGRFTRIEQLREVDGIGPAKFGQLKDLVVVR